MRLLLLAALGAATLAAQQWKPLFNGKDLTGWEVRGEGIWTVLPGGVLLGQRRHDNVERPFGPGWPVEEKRYRDWFYRHAWLYSKEEFGEFDLQLEYLIPSEMNSGVSIRDRSRAHHPIGESDAARPDLASFPKTTPAHIGYEIQIHADDEKYPSGSVYSLTPAPRGKQKSNDWNRLEIQSRNNGIRVLLNGEEAARHAGVPGRSLTGPIGLQLHDQLTFVMFRNIRLRPLGEVR